MIDFGYEGQPLATEQLKAIHDVVIRNCEIWNCESALKTRNAGIRGLMVSDTHVHGCVGTEGGWDFGEWPDDTEAILIPGSASRNIEFVRCDSYENNFIQQANGWVFQPCVSNVTFRQCRAWNNGKYGFACKGSGGFRLDRCAAWGNSSTQMYCRGMATLDDGTPRPPFVNDFVLTNCVFLAPADQRGGAALNIRENASVAVYHCTIVGLRDASYGESGGYALLQGQHHEVTSELSMYNSIAVGYTDAQAVRMFDAHAPSDQFMCYTSYKGDRNLYFAQTSTAFKYQKKNWPSVDGWRAYFAAGEPQGDNQENGPMQSFADEYSLYQEPGFQDMSPDDAPLVLAASNDFLNDHMDVRPGTNSPALSAGQNLAPLQISELQFDYLGNPRPTGTPATIGAFNGSGGSSVSGGI
jgi:hypothetical protein